MDQYPLFSWRKTSILSSISPSTAHPDRARMSAIPSAIAATVSNALMALLGRRCGGGGIHGTLADNVGGNETGEPVRRFG